MRIKNKIMFAGIFLVLTLFLVSSVSALNISTSSYSVNSTHLGASGTGNISTTNYQARDTITYQQAGTRSVTTTSYTANSGWFAVAAQAVGSVNITEIFFSNETVFNYSNVFNASNIIYNMTLEYIGVNCTALSGSVSNVTFSLFNTEDNTTYVNETGYTFKQGDAYVWNASYKIRDSGNWTLNVSCSASGSGSTDRDASLWEIAWGTIVINLINPLVDRAVQIYQFFTFSVNVTCTGGECGIVNVTLDPEECQEVETCENITIGEECVNETVQSCDEECSIEKIETCEDITTNNCIGYEIINDSETDNCLDYEVIENCTSVEKEICVDVNCIEEIIENCTDIIEETCTIETVCEYIEDEVPDEGVEEAETDMLGEEFEQGEILETDEGKDLGEKTEDEPEYETYFLSMEQNDKEFIVVFYHDFNGTLPIRIEGDVNYSLDRVEANYLENVTLIVELVEGILPQFELHIGTDSEVFTFGKVIPVVELKEGNYTLIDRDDLKLDVKVEFKSEEKVILRGLEDEPNVNVTLGINLQEDVSTSIIAVPSLNIENATIVLDKQTDKGVNAIIICEDSEFDYETLECSDWKYANIDFVENSETGKIEFSVDHFTAYAGGNLTAAETAFLTIWDYNDVDMPNASANTTDVKIANETIQFFADYKLAKNATKLSNGNCLISFSDNSSNIQNMTYNSSYTYFLYERNFTSNGAYTYAVSCIHASYTDLNASDSIIIGQYSNETKGAVSTVTGAVPFYTTSSNPQQTSNLRGGENQTISWSVHATGILNKIYDFFVEAIGAFVSYTTSSHVNITITANDTALPVISEAVRPSAVINGSNVTINANVEDNVQVDSVWANITLPDNSSVFIPAGSLPYVYTTNATQIGAHTVTFYANDSSGNNATSVKTFTTALPINLTVNVEVSVDVTMNVSTSVIASVFVAGTNEVLSTTDINGSASLYLPNVPVDIEFNTTFDNDSSLTLLFNFNLTESVGGSIDFGNIRIDPYLKTYGVTTNFSFTSAQVTIDYSNTGYTDENNLQLHKCDNYSVGTGTCISGFNDITTATGTTKDETNDRFIYTTTSFSGFGIKQYVPPTTTPTTGGGGCTYDWVCDEWSECVNGEQTRICTNQGTCRGTTDKPEEIQTCVIEEIEEEIPEQLFDITFNLDGLIIQNTNELSGVVTFESFGKVPTPVNLTFIILDVAGNEVYREVSAITVTTEEVMRWNYESLSALPEGKYTAILETLYNVDVFDEFKQEFEIGPERRGITGGVIGWIGGSGKWYLIGIVVGVLVIVLIWLSVRRAKAKKKGVVKKKKLDDEKT